MPNPILPRRSYTANAQPTANDILPSELAINWTDGKIFTRDASNQIISWTLGGGGGGSDPRWSYLVPAAPTSVAGTAGNAQVALTWTAPSSPASISDYVVQYSSDNGSTWTTFADGTSTSNSATVSNLTNGTSYKFRVAAVSGIGQGAYSSASATFTPGGDPDFASVLMLSRFDGSNNSTTLVDSSSYGRTITAQANAKLTTSYKQWGTASLALDGSSYASTTGAGAIGSGDYTVEFWVYVTSFSNAYMTAMGSFASSNSGQWQLLCNNNQNLTWFGPSAFSAAYVPLTTGAWAHVAFVRSGSTLSSYKDGSRVATATDTANYTGNGSFWVGQAPENNSGRQWSGYIDDLRISTVARYTGSTYTVPTAAFPDA